MVSAVSNKEPNRVSHGAIKDVVPQQVNQKLPENIQNIDGEKIKNETVNFDPDLSCQSFTLSRQGFDISCQRYDYTH